MDAFDKHWRERLALQAEDADPSVELSVETPDDSLEWTQDTLLCLREHFSPTELAEMMTQQACRYPPEDLAALRELYLDTGDVDAVMAALQSGFETMLRDRLGLTPEEIAMVKEMGMGPAGVRQGDTIIATKIPKSGYLKQWLHEPDAEKRREIYCHCPRVRTAATQGVVDPVYCYCGAGFYRHIWESALGVEVSVSMLDSILGGGDVCRIEIKLPEGVVKS